MVFLILWATYVVISLFLSVCYIIGCLGREKAASLKGIGLCFLFPVSMFSQKLLNYTKEYFNEKFE